MAARPAPDPFSNSHAHMNGTFNTMGGHRFGLLSKKMFFRIIFFNNPVEKKIFSTPKLIIIVVEGNGEWLRHYLGINTLMEKNLFELFFGG